MKNLRELKKDLSTHRSIDRSKLKRIRKKMKQLDYKRRSLGISSTWKPGSPILWKGEWREDTPEDNEPEPEPFDEEEVEEDWDELEEEEE